MTTKITLEQALEKASPRLQRKMLESVALLKKAERLSLLYDADEGFHLAFSGGKDSQALYHITELSGCRFKAHFSPTSVDPPQLIKFIRHNPNTEFGKITKNMYDMAVEKMILPTPRVRWCCAEYKEMSGAGKVTLIGIRHSESHRRAKRKEVEVSSKKFSGNFEQFTEWQEEVVKKKYKNLNQDQFTHDKKQEVRCINGKDSILVSPIIEWTEADVWEFLDKVMEVPHCELYDKGYHRIGCILCPMSQHKQKLRECKDFPYVKAKWIDVIKRIRCGGGREDSCGGILVLGMQGRRPNGQEGEYVADKRQFRAKTMEYEPRYATQNKQFAYLKGETGRWMGERKNTGIWKDGGIGNTDDYP